MKRFIKNSAVVLGVLFAAVTTTTSVAHAATGLFGTIVYTQTSAGLSSWAPTTGGYFHITIAGGGSYYGSQNVKNFDVSLSANQTVWFQVGAHEVQTTYVPAATGGTGGLNMLIKDLFLAETANAQAACPSGADTCTPGSPGGNSWASFSSSGTSPIATASGLSDVPSACSVGSPNTCIPFGPQGSGRNGYVIVESETQPTQTFDTPGTYKVCYVSGTGCSFIIPAGNFNVQVWGAGGGGGNSNPQSGTPDSGGAGGGGYSSKSYSGLSAGTSFYITVGAGGSGAPFNTSYNPGKNGGCSFFTWNSADTCSTFSFGATGGMGSNNGGPGTGGAGRGGTVNYNGNAGTYTSGVINANGGTSGFAACSGPLYLGTHCSSGYQDNQPGNSINGYTTHGLDNFNWARSLLVGTNGWDTSGGDGYAPGNGGANGAGNTAGGKGGDGMVVIRSVAPGGYLDVLRVQTSSGKIHIAGVTDTTQSVLHVYNSGTTYAVSLVPPADANASPVRVMTPSGVMALRLCTTANGCTVASP